MGEKAAEETTKLLAGGMDPLEIVNGELIPALDIVGKGFDLGGIILDTLRDIFRLHARFAGRRFGGTEHLVHGFLRRNLEPQVIAVDIRGDETLDLVGEDREICHEIEIRERIRQALPCEQVVDLVHAERLELVQIARDLGCLPVEFRLEGARQVPEAIGPVLFAEYLGDLFLDILDDGLVIRNQIDLACGALRFPPRNC